MSEFNAETGSMRTLAGELKSIKRTLHTIAWEVSNCSGNLKGQSASLAMISLSLNRIVKQIENESVSSNNLAVALLDIAVQYQRTENKILGISSPALDLYALIREAEKKFIDILKKLGIIKGGSSSDTSSYAGDPVDVTSGNYVDDITELRIYGPCNLCMVRHYNSRFINLGSLGIGWTHNYEISLLEEENDLIITWGDQTKEVFESTGEGVYRSKAGNYDHILKNDDGFVYCKDSGQNLHFNQIGSLISYDIGKGKGSLFFAYGEEGLSKVTDSYGNSLRYRYNDDGLLGSVEDHTGRKVSFTYEDNCLTCAEEADGLRTMYEYDDSGRLAQIIGPDGTVCLINQYDEENRVTGQKLPDGSEISFRYIDDKVLFTDRNGAETVYIVDDRLRITEARYPAGTEKFAYNKYNKRIMYTDLNGFSYHREYDARGNIRTYEDPLGNIRDFVYDSKGDRIEASAPDRGRITAIYDDDHNLLERTDSLGNRTSFAYKGGLLESVIYPDESRMTFAYDEQGRLSSVTDENGNVTSYVYDSLGRKILEENGCGERTYFEYDAMDRFLKVTNAAGYERIFKYKYGRLCKLIDFDGYTESWDYDQTGHVAAYCDKAGRKTQYAYDNMANVNLIILPDGEKITRTFDTMNRLVEECGPGERRLSMEYDPNGNCIHREENGHSTDIVYDALNRIEKVSSNSGSGRSFTYDCAGRMTGICREDGLNINYSYDTEGRLLSTFDSAGHLSEFRYDQRGRLIKRTGNKDEDAEYQYYPNGLVRSVLWQNQDSRKNEYDAAGRLAKVTFASGYSIEYAYDSLGRRTAITDSDNRKRSWEYDAAGNIVSEGDPLGRTTSFSYSPTGKLVYMRNALGNEFRYGYDAMDRMILLLKGEMSNEEAVQILHDADRYLEPENESIHLTKWVRSANGRLTARIDAKGNREEWSYHPDGQPAFHTDAEGRNTSWQYDEAMNVSAVHYSDRNVAKYQYNKMGWITGINDWTGELSLDYDAYGRITSSSDREGQKVIYNRDSEGRPVQVIYPDGIKINYSYSENGQTSAISSDGMTSSYTYDDLGRLQKKSLILDGADEAREFTEEYRYCDSGKLRAIDYLDRSSKRMSLSFLYDDAGNMTRRDRTDWNCCDGTEATESRRYEYDEMNRVRKVFAETPDTEGRLIEEYQYDEFGNCVKKVIDGEVTDYYYNVLEQLTRKTVTSGGNTEETVYSYDKDGRLISEQGPSKILREYNAQGNLSKITSGQETVSFDVNSLGGVLAESFSNGTGKKFWLDYAQRTMPVLGINSGEGWECLVRDKSLSAGRKDGKWGAFVCDERGSVLQFLNQESGWADRTGQTDYDTYGNMLGKQTANTDNLSFGYTGLYRMPVVNTWKTTSREYDPNAGRFLSRDRDEFMRIRLPETMHQYLYCYGNPMIWIDPEGTDCYIFYLPEWKNEAVNDRRQLAKQYGYDESKVHLIPITSNSDFRNGWNNMGMEGGNEVDIDTVLINTHGNPNALGDNGNFGIGTNFIRHLDDKEAENLILLGCNSGHKDYADNNVAAAFAEKIEGAPVIASDGTVYSGFSLFNWFDRSYKSKNDEDFRDWRSGSNRDNAGWVVYQVEDGKVTTRDVNDKKMTVTDMVNELRKYPRQAADCSFGGGIRGGGFR